MATRVRNKEHVPGNWATLIFIPGNFVWIEGALFMFCLVQTSLPSLQLPEGCSVVDPIIDEVGLHISLSRVLYVKEMQIEFMM